MQNRTTTITILYLTKVSKIEYHFFYPDVFDIITFIFSDYGKSEMEQCPSI